MADQLLDGDLADGRRRAAPLTDTDLPGIFRASDDVSLLGQRRQVRGTATLLIPTSSCGGDFGGDNYSQGDDASY